MPGEIGERSRRSLARKVTRRGNDEARGLAQQSRAKSGIGQRAQPQGHIGAFGDQVFGPVGHQQLDAQFRMLRREARQTRDDFANSEMPPTTPPAMCRAGCLLRARHFRHRRDRQNLPRPFEKHPAGVGRRDVPRGAQEKLHTQPRLEVCHHPRYRGLRHPEFARDAEKLPVSPARTKAVSSRSRSLIRLAYKSDTRWLVYCAAASMSSLRSRPGAGGRKNEEGGANDDDSPHHRSDERNRPRGSRQTGAVRRPCHGRGPQRATR